MNVREPHQTETDQLAELWHRGWHDAHADLVPPDLSRLRTLQNFRKRITLRFSDVRVAGPLGEPTGLCIITGDELEQLYVARHARGTGVAAKLVTDAERLLLERGIKDAWLACAIGNTRAARFYEKCGWRLAGTQIENLETSEGHFPLEIWRFEKRLSK